MGHHGSLNMTAITSKHFSLKTTGGLEQHRATIEALQQHFHSLATACVMPDVERKFLDRRVVMTCTNASILRTLCAALEHQVALQERIQRLWIQREVLLAVTLGETCAGRFVNADCYREWVACRRERLWRRRGCGNAETNADTSFTGSTTTNQLKEPCNRRFHSDVACTTACHARLADLLQRLDVATDAVVDGIRLWRSTCFRRPLPFLVAVDEEDDDNDGEADAEDQAPHDRGGSAYLAPGDGRRPVTVGFANALMLIQHDYHDMLVGCFMHLDGLPPDAALAEPRVPSNYLSYSSGIAQKLHRQASCHASLRQSSSVASGSVHASSTVTPATAAIDAVAAGDLQQSRSMAMEPLSSVSGSSRSAGQPLCDADQRRHAVRHELSVQRCLLTEQLIACQRGLFVLTLRAVTPDMVAPRPVSESPPDDATGIAQPGSLLRGSSAARDDSLPRGTFTLTAAPRLRHRPMASFSSWTSRHLALTSGPRDVRDTVVCVSDLSKPVWSQKKEPRKGGGRGGVHLSLPPLAEGVPPPSSAPSPRLVATRQQRLLRMMDEQGMCPFEDLPAMIRAQRSFQAAMASLDGIATTSAAKAVFHRRTLPRALMQPDDPPASKGVASHQHSSQTKHESETTLATQQRDEEPLVAPRHRQKSSLTDVECHRHFERLSRTQLRQRMSAWYRWAKRRIHRRQTQLQLRQLSQLRHAVDRFARWKVFPMAHRIKVASSVSLWRRNQSRIGHRAMRRWRSVVLLKRIGRSLLVNRLPFGICWHRWARHRMARTMAFSIDSGDGTLRCADASAANSDRDASFADALLTVPRFAGAAVGDDRRPYLSAVLRLKMRARSLSAPEESAAKTIPHVDDGPHRTDETIDGSQENKDRENTASGSDARPQSPSEQRIPAEATKSSSNGPEPDALPQRPAATEAAARSTGDPAPPTPPPRRRSSTKVAAFVQLASSTTSRRTSSGAINPTTVTSSSRDVAPPTTSP